MPEAKKLTQLQRRFGERVAAGENQTKVIRDLCPTLARPDVKAAKLMALPHVQEYVAQLNNQAMQNASISRIRVAKELGRIAFADPRKLFDDDGSLKPISEMDDDTVAVIAGVDVEELFEGRGDERKQTGNLRRVKMWNKREALTELAVMLGMKREIAKTDTPIGPGMTVIVQDGGQFNLQQNQLPDGRVAVNLPKPGK